MPFEDYRKHGDRPFRVRYCCGGVVLIKRNVLTTLSNPFYPNLDERGYLQGVDISLYERARQNGFTCWIEPSIKCGHIGQFAFLPQDYYSLLDGGLLKNEK